MKKIILTIFIFMAIILVITGCGNIKKEEANITPKEINDYIINYFQDGNKNENYSYNYVDEEANIVIVGLINNQKEEQDKFINDIFTSCCDSKYINYIKENDMIKFEESSKALVDYEIGKLIDIIISNGPKTSSNPFDYINVSEGIYNKLLNSPKVTFEYAIKDLIDTNANNGLVSYIEALLCSKINTSFRYDFETGNDYLEHYKKFLTECDCIYNEYDNYAKSLLK